MYIGGLALCSQVVSPVASNHSCVTLAGSHSSVFLQLIFKKGMYKPSQSVLP